MANNKDVPSMIRGMSAATRLVALLFEEVTRQEGHEEVLFYLTTRRGRENLESTVQHLLSLEWSIPLSHIRRRARELSKQSWAESECHDIDEIHTWLPVLNELKIPSIYFGIEGEREDDWESFDQISEQIIGKTYEIGMFVTWRDEDYIIVQWQGKEPKIGEIISSGPDTFVALSLARRFDLEN